MALVGLVRHGADQQSRLAWQRKQFYVLMHGDVCLRPLACHDYTAVVLSLPCHSLRQPRGTLFASWPRLLSLQTARVQQRAAGC